MQLHWAKNEENGIKNNTNENFALVCILQKSKGANIVRFWRK